MPPSLRIALDARAASHPQAGGFKAYVEGLIQGLAALDSPHRFLLCVDRPYPPAGDLPSNFALEIIAAGPPLVGAGLREQVALPLRLARARAHVTHYPYNTSPFWAPGRRVVTIHDLILLQPQAVSTGSLRRRLMNSYYRLFLLWAARSAHAVITVSQFSAAELVARVPTTAGKVHVIPPAASAVFRPQDPGEAAERVAQVFGLAPGYVLVIGSADPRKNVAAALQAYAGLPLAMRQAHRLVVVLAHSALQSDLERQSRELDIAPQVTFQISPVTPALQILYAAAGVFLFPSLYEGFGLPPLEAMACGAPLVASNATSIPEVVGEAGLLVAPGDVPALTAALQAVLSDAALARQMREKGLRRAAQFSWVSTARQAVAVYEQAWAAGAAGNG